MFKKGLLTIIILASACLVKAQTLHYKAINVGSGNYYISHRSHNSHSPFIVSIHQHAVTLKNTATRVNNNISFGVSPDHSLFGSIYSSNGSYMMGLFENPGKKILNISSLSFGTNDPSIKIYPLNNGRVIIRSNIAHFDIYNPSGKVQASFSNSSGSLQGETISKLATDYSGETVIAYNPKINKNGHEESRIQRVNPDNGHVSTIYYNNKEAISKLLMSHSGNFLAVLFRHKKNSQILIMDTYGNIVHHYKFDYKVDHIAFSNDDRYITMVQGNSVRVFNTYTGHKAGASYLRGYDVTYANYIPQDHVILGLGTDFNESSHTLHKIEFSMVNLRKRKIASKTYSGNLTWYPGHFPLQIVRLGRDHYRINGFSDPFRVRGDF